MSPVRDATIAAPCWEERTMPRLLAILLLALAVAACERSDSHSTVDGLRGRGGTSGAEGAFTQSPAPRAYATP